MIMQVKNSKKYNKKTRGLEKPLVYWVFEG
jgi:hypothetical protein